MKMTRFAMILLTSFSWMGLLTPLMGWSQSCRENVDCSDGLYCNGVELCRLGRCVAGNSDVCRPGERCDLERDRCVIDCPVPLDADGDGHRASLCGGDDCDDNDVNRYPGNSEVCDLYGHDEDCDSTTFGYRDSDGDGYVDALCRN